MKDDIERYLQIAAFYKFLDGEPMSPQDVARMIAIFDTGKLEVAQADPAQIAGIRIQLKTVLQKRYLADQKQTVP